MISKDFSFPGSPSPPFTHSFRVKCAPQSYELTGERDSDMTAIEILRDQRKGNYYLNIHFRDFLLYKNDLSDGPCFQSFQEVIVKGILPFFYLTVTKWKIRSDLGGPRG